ncbi:hypothetical protein HMPREF9120_02606 [Neisseria sp. oral taxon 020 str. F0370]|nr:hypothetical protein HMPREF9120_02606 [Neisseria sp. oral taxon 020 str. F0370]
MSALSRTLICCRPLGCGSKTVNVRPSEKHRIEMLYFNGLNKPIPNI